MTNPPTSYTTSWDTTLPESADDQPADQLHHVLGHDR